MNFKYKTKPYKHQEEALEKSFDKRNFAYFMEMGCGKSKVLIDNMAWLYENRHIDSAIIVAPKGVYLNWRDNEIPIHMRENIDHEIYVWKANLNKRETEKLRGSVTERHQFRIILINVEAFATKKVLQYLEHMTMNVFANPQSSSNNLWHLEGQRYLLGIIKNKALRGKK